MKNIFKKDKTLSVVLSVLFSFLFVFAFVNAATTISTNINTGGTLTVTGASTLTGATTLSSTLDVTGATTLNGNVTLGDAVTDVITANGYLTQARIGTGSTFGHVGTIGADELGIEGDLEIDGTAWFDGVLHASSTALLGGALTTYGNTTFGDAAGDVNLFTGTLQASTTALFTSGLTSYGTITLQNAETISNATDGVIQLGGVASTTSLTLLNGETITNATDGTIALTGNATVSGTLNVTGNSIFSTASSTGLFTLDSVKVSSTGSTVTGLLFGTCAVNFGTSLGAGVATTTNCVATGVTTNHKVFMTPSGLETYVAFNSASSTANDVIQVQVFNTSTSTPVTIASRTWSWIAIK